LDIFGKLELKHGLKFELKFQIWKRNQKKEKNKKETSPWDDSLSIA
jgi:hypothetical protein